MARPTSTTKSRKSRKSATSHTVSTLSTKPEFPEYLYIRLTEDGTAEIVKTTQYDLNHLDMSMCTPGTIIGEYVMVAHREVVPMLKPRDLV